MGLSRTTQLILNYTSFPSPLKFATIDWITDTIDALETPSFEDLIIKIRANDEEDWMKCPVKKAGWNCFAQTAEYILRSRIYTSRSNILHVEIYLYDI
ncbi:hypothetical protein EW145_g308 [Phellinidium pouzarii]|uniref:Uncharacterized protein n=1 Tax=Phellinidium pouzarii TaxID=167371 RepID=A0A4S4LJA4_9AGAM|nr:hypothetical protein EW145_g308 [Phellinidium pouzarii]